MAQRSPAFTGGNKPGSKPMAGKRGMAAMPVAGRRSSVTSLGARYRDDDAASHASTESEYIKPVIVSVPPRDQEPLPADPKLREEFLNQSRATDYTAANPNASKNKCHFVYRDGVYKFDPVIDHLQVHFAMDGVLIHVDSGEAKTQTENDRRAREALDRAREQLERAAEQSGKALAAGADATAAEAALVAAGGRGVLRNQFNFSERAGQTVNAPLRNRATQTEPAPTSDFDGQVTAWEIFDTYVEDVERQVQARAPKEKKRAEGKEDDKETALLIAAAVGASAGDKKDEKKDVKADEKADPLKAAAAKIGASSGSSASGSGSGATGPNPDGAAYDVAAHNDDLFASDAMLRALKVMERMVNQNAEAKIYHDYKYHESLHEAKNEESRRGTFYPLWPFAPEHEHADAAGRTVTCIVWNPEYTDLFAVGFGSYDFIHQKSGLICCYTLKNTTHPEYTFQVDSGVMCLDFHPQHSSLLAVGMYDGTVCVFDVRNKSAKPIYMSADPKSKHTDPVWQVRWAFDDESGKPVNFFSVSSDGRVTNWILNKNELTNEELLTLKLVTKPEIGSQAAANAHAQHAAPAAVGAAAAAGSAPVNGSGKHDDDDQLDDQTDAALVGLAGGCCFDFNKSEEHIFVVGTEEGAIHKYSKAYNSQYLQSFDGHHMAVYTVRWNPFHPGVFLSCSADWTVKLWETGTPNPLMTFEFETSVGDVAWAPFSATTFACVTNDGKLRLYDLSVDKHEPIGEDYVHIDKRKDRPIKPTHLAFNPREPILAVGDESGVVSILKLSGNLRRTYAPNANVDLLDSEREADRLDSVLIIQNPDGTVTRMSDRKRPPKQVRLTAKQKAAAAAAAAAAIAEAAKKAAATQVDADGKPIAPGDGDGAGAGGGGDGAGGSQPPLSARGATPRGDGDDSDDEKRSTTSSAAPYLDRSASKMGQRKGAITPLSKMKNTGFGPASPNSAKPPASAGGGRPVTPGAGPRVGSQAFN